MSTYEPTPRTELNRSKYRGRTNIEEVNAILDAARVGTLAWADDNGQPFMIPIAYARDEQRLLFHGSTGAGGLRELAAGRPCAFNVTILDALVLARSAFESSMRYRSVSVLGTCRVLTGNEKWQALDVITEHLFPGRTKTLRPMQEKEVAATMVLELPLVEVSAKVSDGWPKDGPEDVQWPVWAGVVPIEAKFGEPLPAADLKDEFATPPDYLHDWRP